MNSKIPSVITKRAGRSDMQMRRSPNSAIGNIQRNNSTPFPGTAQTNLDQDLLKAHQSINPNKLSAGEFNQYLENAKKVDPNFDRAKLMQDRLNYIKTDSNRYGEWNPSAPEAPVEAAPAPAPSVIKNKATDPYGEMDIEVDNRTTGQTLGRIKATPRVGKGNNQVSTPETAPSAAIPAAVRNVNRPKSVRAQSKLTEATPVTTPTPETAPSVIANRPTRRNRGNNANPNAEYKDKGWWGNLVAGYNNDSSLNPNENLTTGDAWSRGIGAGVRNLTDIFAPGEVGQKRRHQALLDADNTARGIVDKGTFGLAPMVAGWVGQGHQFDEVEGASPGTRAIGNFAGNTMGLATSATGAGSAIKALPNIWKAPSALGKVWRGTTTPATIALDTDAAVDSAGQLLKNFKP